MVSTQWIAFAVGGLVSGILAGFLGIGGGTVLVPLQVALGYSPVQSVATSSLAIVVTSISGSIQNWRMGYLNFKRVLSLGLPALLTAQIGVYLANIIAPRVLLMAFGILLLLNIYLVELPKLLTARVGRSHEALCSLASPQPQRLNATISRICTGGAAGILAGLFGVGGGVIMVPLQMLLLGEPIKVAIQTSLGVIVLTAISAAIGHTLSGNVLFLQGIILGSGGLLGAQISTRFLPKLPDRVVSLAFRFLLAILSVYIFWQAWQR